MKPLISVIIPAYNEKKYLRSTLDSVVKQNYKNFEIIGVPNGCTDNTYDIFKEYTNKVINLDKRNVSLARNKGAEVAKGDILVFLDADVTLEQDVFNYTLSQLNKEEYSVGTYKINTTDDNLTSKIFVSFKNLYHNLGFVGSGGLIYCTKEMFNKIGGFDINRNILEIRNFYKKAKRKGAKFKCLNHVHVNLSMRRLKKWGFKKMWSFWTTNILNDKAQYEPVR